MVRIMEKKNYGKPRMKIIKVRRPMIICFSNDGGEGAPQLELDEEE